MPYVCCVTTCKGNYPNGPKVSVFGFPRDEGLRRKWISAIPRKDFEPSETSKVCELHFHAHDILRASEYYDEKSDSSVEAAKAPKQCRAFHICRMSTVSVRTIRQVMECESKLRIQTFMPLILASDSYGEVECDIQCDEIHEQQGFHSSGTVPAAFDAITIDDYNVVIQHSICALTYVAGYCVHAALKKLKCENCRGKLVLDVNLSFNKSFELIRNLDRGGLKHPCDDIVTLVIGSYIVISKLLSKLYEKEFLQTINHRCMALSVILSVLGRNEIFLDFNTCQNGHSGDYIMKLILRVATNVFLNNYTRKVKEKLRGVCKKRKVMTLAKPK